jgi:hypothetical protein
MTWVMAGGYPTDEVKPGHSLIKSGNLSVIICWGTKEMDPEIGNGRLIVSFDINAWGDYAEGRISRTTMAVIQNIYDLMSGTKQYGLLKSFSQDGTIPELEDGKEGTCYITIKNNAVYPIEVSALDTLSKCFEFVPSGGDAPNKITPSGGKTILEWNGIKLDGRQSKTIKFNYKVKYNPPCE